MNEIRAFWPAYTPSEVVNGVSINGTLLPSTTLAATDTAQTTARFAGSDKNTLVQFQIANISTGGTPAWAYVNFGVFGAITAATVAASYPIAPNTVIVVSVDQEVTGASVILGTAASTANVTFTRGSGVGT